MSSKVESQPKLNSPGAKAAGYFYDKFLGRPLKVGTGPRDETIDDLREMAEKFNHLIESGSLLHPVERYIDFVRDNEFWYGRLKNAWEFLVKLEEKEFLEEAEAWIRTQKLLVISSSLVCLDCGSRPLMDFSCYCQSCWDKLDTPEYRAAEAAKQAAEKEAARIKREEAIAAHEKQQAEWAEMRRRTSEYCRRLSEERRSEKAQKKEIVQ